MVVGRRAPAGLRIPDKRISHLHARFTLVDDHVLVEDLDSTNGTWVNCERITAPTMLAPGGDAILGDVSAHVVAIVRSNVGTIHDGSRSRFSRSLRSPSRARPRITRRRSGTTSQRNHHR
ncbi:FHA domain-containing protein [Sorangium sp. So ce1014]|uniref:FHA domain-containing protein n=1 Tax=Sorangium sp. So ce1014 TaxID=3133326 RepID=UPI003F5F294A